MALQAFGALSAGWCLFSPGRKPPNHVIWRNTKMDRRLRSFVESAGSAVILTQGSSRGRAYALVNGPEGCVFVKAVDGNTALLSNEAQMLRGVGRSCAPALLHEHIEADAGFIVVEGLRPDLRRPSLAPDARAIELLESLPRHGEEDAEYHPWVASLLTSGSPEDVVRWGETLCRRRWPLVTLHGDFTPLNLAMRQTGEPVLVDWEFGSLAGFPGADAAHWVITVGAEFAHVSADTICSTFAAWACGHEHCGVRISQDEARAILALTAYWQYRGDRANRSDADNIQRVRASLWAYDSA